MERYAYHQPNFLLLGKNETEKYRNIDPKFVDVEKTRDYAEILKFEFDNEIVSGHFGNYWSLSIKGYSARFFPNPKYGSGEKKLQHTFIHTSLMDQRKMQQHHMRTC